MNSVLINLSVDIQHNLQYNQLDPLVNIKNKTKTVGVHELSVQPSYTSV